MRLDDLCPVSVREVGDDQEEAADDREGHDGHHSSANCGEISVLAEGGESRGEALVEESGGRVHRFPRTFSNARAMSSMSLRGPRNMLCSSQMDSRQVRSLLGQFALVKSTDAFGKYGPKAFLRKNGCLCSEKP